MGTMKKAASLPLLLLSLGAAAADTFAASSGDASVYLATFDGRPGTTFDWRELNDPVMGGRSSGTLTTTGMQLRDLPARGIFDGECEIVPFLKAPGFCKASTEKEGSAAPDTYNDVSEFISGALFLKVRTTTPGYYGFKVAFGAKNATKPHPSPYSHGSNSFKADFNVTGSNDFQTVKIPFNNFSIDWSDFTGECDTVDPNGNRHLCCSAKHPEVCPQAHHLKAITFLSVWAEGVAGKFHLEIESIGAGPL